MIPPSHPDHGDDGQPREVSGHRLMIRTFGGKVYCAYQHIPSLVYTRRMRDLFRKRIWVRCHHCDLRMGPFTARSDAEREQQWVWDFNRYLDGFKERARV